VGEAVPNKAELALLNVLLDGVESLLLGDLEGRSVIVLGWNLSWNDAREHQLRCTHFHLRIGPARHFDDHVEHGLLLVGIEGNVVPWRNELTVLLDEDAVFERVCRGDLAGGVRHAGWSTLPRAGGFFWSRRWGC
jgi:hypothetical protein